MVEFVIIAPVMLLMLLLAVDFGRLFFSYVAVSNAAREAAFHASVHASDDDWKQDEYEAAVAQVAQLELANQGQAGEGALTVSGPTCFAPPNGSAISCASASDFAAGIGNHVSVSVSRPFTFLTPLIGDLFGGQVTLEETATAPVLNPASLTIVGDDEFVPPPTPTPAPTPTPTPAPTATPTPAPTPTPSPGATPTPSPSPSPTPAPTPIPTPTPPPMCVVPDFVGTWFEDIGALAVWQTQGFTGTLTDDSSGKKIKSQTLPAGDSVLCSSDMTVSRRN